MSESDITEEEQRNAIITTITLDISNKHLKEVPKTIKNFSNIEFLYLCTNDIKSIPDHFFTSLPQLKWLDFRHNLLTTLPTSIGEHRQLRTLLLQGNQLATLPVELGNVPTLTGLNIADNPIEYPPKTVLQEGTQEILKYLRLELQSESQLIPELIDALEEVHITENEGYLGSGEDEDGRVLGPIKRMSRRKNRTQQEIQSPLNNRSATLLPRKKETRWSASDTLITSKPKMPKRRKKFRSANPIERVRRSDHYIQKAIQDYEEKRMQAIRKEENSRTEMMVQRMRDRDALKMWRQQSIRQIESRKSGIVSSRSSERSGEKKLKLKRLEKTATSKTNLEHIIGYITTQIEALKLREQRLCYEINNANGPELKKLRRIIERKQIELLEMRKKRARDDNSQVLPMKRNHTLASIKPIKQKAVSMTNKELELRNKIKEHAVRLKEYHNSEKKKRSEAQLNLDQAQDIHDEMRQLNTEYRFRAFTGETAD
ncbi:leucine-rich repeat-containing protein 27-like isoform X2 [Bolinopsis microptera]|uniref:leucine-rich repeat-containing protein 27-like isoform X2 n=1 Tax=Bolinopsis microptera TaxID=2820187 RepID=UPI00307A30CF